MLFWFVLEIKILFNINLGRFCFCKTNRLLLRSSLQRESTPPTHSLCSPFGRSIYSAFKISASQSVVPRATALAPPENLLEMQNQPARQTSGLRNSGSRAQQSVSQVTLGQIKFLNYCCREKRKHILMLSSNYEIMLLRPPTIRFHFVC